MKFTKILISDLCPTATAGKFSYGNLVFNVEKNGKIQLVSVGAE